MDIRALEREDRPRLAGLAARAIRSGCAGSYTRTQIAAWVRSHDAGLVLRAEQVLVACAGPDVLGFAGVDTQRVVPLRFVFVDPPHWRRGAGRALVQALEQVCLDKGLAEIAVAAARHAEVFYASMGYEVGHRLRALLPAARSGRPDVDVDVVTMFKPLRALEARAHQGR